MEIYYCYCLYWIDFQYMQMKNIYLIIIRLFILYQFTFIIWPLFRLFDGKQYGIFRYYWLTRLTSWTDRDIQPNPKPASALLPFIAQHRSVKAPLSTEFHDRRGWALIDLGHGGRARVMYIGDVWSAKLRVADSAESGVRLIGVNQRVAAAGTGWLVQASVLYYGWQTDGVTRTAVLASHWSVSRNASRGQPGTHCLGWPVLLPLAG